MTDSPSESRAATHQRGVHRLEFGVDWPPGHVAAYLINGDEPVLIDTGMAGDRGRETLHDKLESHGLGAGDIDHLVLTHPHVDHLGQAATVIEAGDPWVYVPEGVQTRLSRDIDDLRSTVERNATAAGVSGKAREDIIEKAVESLRRDRALLPNDKVDRWVADDASIQVGDVSLQAVHTPGHQADHLCYQSEVGDERVLFSGDMANKPFRSVAIHVGLDDGVEESIGAFYTALDRLSDLDIDRVYPGHGPVHDDFAGSIDRSVRSLDRLLESSLEALRDGASTAAEVANRRQGRAMVYLLPETVGALAYLEATGRAISHMDGGVRRYEPR